MDNCFKKGLWMWMPVCCELQSFFSFSKPVSWVNGFEMNKDASKSSDALRDITKAESANSLCKSRWIVGFSSIQEKAIQASPLSLEQPKLLSSPPKHQLDSPYWSIIALSKQDLRLPSLFVFYSDYTISLQNL